MLKITVTAEDIANGQKAQADKCMVALACARAGLVNPSVDSTVIDGYEKAIVDHGEYQDERIILPDEVGALIENFDAGLPVAPFEFEVDL